MRENKKTKCFILHGFGGGIYEVKPLAEYLNSLGYEVFCPVLKGHCSTAKDMRRTTYREWVQRATENLLDWVEEEDEIILIGFSMGGLIALNLACKCRVKSIITINTPIFYWNLPQVCTNLLEDLKNRRCTHIRRYLGAKKSSPLRSMIQFLRLLHDTKPKLKNIDSPILIIQAGDDDTVKRKSADYIYNHICSKNKEVRHIEEGGHLILLSKNANQVMRLIKDFIA